MPTEAGIHDFADANAQVVDGGLHPGPAPAMTGSERPYVTRTLRSRTRPRRPGVAARAFARPQQTAPEGDLTSKNGGGWDDALKWQVDVTPSQSHCCRSGSRDTAAVTPAFHPDRLRGHDH